MRSTTMVQEWSRSTSRLTNPTSLRRRFEIFGQELKNEKSAAKKSIHRQKHKSKKLHANTTQIRSSERRFNGSDPWCLAISIYRVWKFAELRALRSINTQKWCSGTR